MPSSFNADIDQLLHDLAEVQHAVCAKLNTACLLLENLQTNCKLTTVERRQLVTVMTKIFQASTLQQQFLQIQQLKRQGSLPVQPIALQQVLERVQTRLPWELEKRGGSRLSQTTDRRRQSEAANPAACCGVKPVAAVGGNVGGEKIFGSSLPSISFQIQKPKLDFIVTANRQVLEMALVEIFLNAVILGTGVVTVTGRSVGSFVVITIKNRGHLTTQQIKQAFQLDDFSRHSVSDLGLALADVCVRSIGGTLKLANRGHDVVTTIRLRLGGK
jgi:hypothetical protein